MTVLLARMVRVDTYHGVPECQTCRTDDCGYVGFTILEQKYDNKSCVLD
jgi:hypothetical protein